ncbi:MAG: response regulator transcription factor [Candidatus Latescibacterota bacterium]|nr:MAG: response regulator transcription factor [Candidatus Latescibacterota bacterium]
MGVTFRCLVVDDEPLARRVIKKYIADVPWLELAGECGNAREAAAWLHANDADVMFLDVRMPGLSGLDFLGTLIERPLVILTTAHSQYALAGYDYSVADFLLKPVSFERFMKAVNKLASRTSAQSPTKDFAFMRADRADHRVRFAEIRYLEAYGNYVKVYLDSGMILVAGTLSAMEQMLPPDRFLRVHRSFVVAIDRIDRIASAQIHIAGDEIPIGRSYRKEVGRIVDLQR